MKRTSILLNNLYSENENNNIINTNSTVGGGDFKNDRLYKALNKKTYKAGGMNKIQLYEYLRKYSINVTNKDSRSTLEQKGNEYLKQLK